MSKKLKPMTRIPLKEEDIEFTFDLVEQLDSAKAGLEALSESLRQKHETLWKSLRGMYPEIEGYKCILRKKSKEIVVISKADAS